MTDIRFNQSLGTNGIIVDGNAYTYKGTTAGTATNLISDATTSGIAGLTYSNADPQGKTVYSIAERSIAGYEFGSSLTMPQNSDKKRMYAIESTAPGINDDSGSNFYVGSRWFNISSGQLYVCTDASSGAAVWGNQNSGTLTTTTGGVMRMWSNSANTSLFITGVPQSNFTGYTSEASSRVFNVASGDYIEVYNVNFANTTTWISLLPFNH